MRLRKSLTSQDSAAEAEAGLVETAAAGLADLGRSEDGGVRRAGGSRPLGRGREGPRSVQCFSWSVRGRTFSLASRCFYIHLEKKAKIRTQDLAISDAQYSDSAIPYLTQCSSQQMSSLIPITYFTHPATHLPSDSTLRSS
ncbi:uncharacterized protein LOC144378734 isoform X2 [Halichoerus grypus]